MYGILRDSTNTNIPGELICTFAAPISVSSRRVVFSSDTLSLKRVAASGSSQRWEIETTIAQSENGVEFFLNSVVNDVDQKVYVRMPQPVQKFGDVVRGLGRSGGNAEEYPTANPTRVSNNDFAFAYGTGDVVSSKGAGESAVGILLDPNSQLFTGSFIRFTNHNKVYLIREITSVSVNTANVVVFPNLTASITGGGTPETAYLGGHVTAHMYYDLDNAIGISYSDGILTDPGVVKLVEAL